MSSAEGHSLVELWMGRGKGSGKGFNETSPRRSVGKI